MAGCLGVLFELLPQPDDVRVHGPRVREGIVTPDGIEQDIAAERFARILQEKREEVKLGARKAHLVTVLPHHPALEIHLNVGKRDDLGGFGRGTAQDSTDARQQLTRAERLYYVIVSADLE
jgi:hypothetical protein